MTNQWFPLLDPQLVDRVNHRIDNPNKADMIIGNVRERVMGDSHFVPGLYKGGHKQYNHDIMSMMLASYQAGGMQGVQVGMSHISQDLISGHLTTALGHEAFIGFKPSYAHERGQARQD